VWQIAPSHDATRHTGLMFPVWISVAATVATGASLSADRRTIMPLIGVAAQPGREYVPLRTMVRVTLSDH
jgi:hypothetical protein